MVRSREPLSGESETRKDEKTKDFDEKCSVSPTWYNEPMAPFLKKGLLVVVGEGTVEVVVFEVMDASEDWC